MCWFSIEPASVLYTLLFISCNQRSVPMSTTHEVQGIIHSIGDTKEFGQNGFTKRDFVIKLTGEGENVAYPNHTTFELIKDKCAMIDAYNLGDEINVAFNVTGRLWTGQDSVEKCFNSLKAWRIQALSTNQNSFHPKKSVSTLHASATQVQMPDTWTWIDAHNV